LNCTAILGGIEVKCQDIPDIKNPVCTCPECVRELQFEYTGITCAQNQVDSAKCTQNSPNPFDAGYRITDALDPTVVLGTGQAKQGDTITITSPTGCIPDTLAVTISAPTGAVTQTFVMDAQCDPNGGRGLILREDYGAFQSTGYSCDENDVNNCVEEVSYGLSVCNVGSEDEIIYDWYFERKEEVSGAIDFIDLLENVNPEDVMLTPGECYYDTRELDIDRCVEQNHCNDLVANATNPDTGIPHPCSALDDLKFGWNITDLPPTEEPSPMPSPPPSPAPTSTCVIDIKLEGCPTPNISLDNDCQGRPQVITFKYTGGDCAQSQNYQSRQKFLCMPTTGPSAPTTEGTVNYIEAVARGGGDTYFAGNVAVGEAYTLNQNFEFDKLSADMTITIYESQGGGILQVVDVHLSCSQALFLFDKFGAHQVVKWIETDGRVVEAQASVTTENFEIKLESSGVTKPVRLLEMQVLTNAQEAPIDYTDDIKDTILSPGDSISLPGFPIDIDLTQRIKYSFFTTIIGETVDGTNMCNGNDFHECTVGFNLSPVFPTDVPTPRPTLTAFPTGPAETTACDISSSIECTVIQPNNPKLPLSCDDLSGESSRSCPATTELLAAFLRYDGSLGDTVFVNPICGKNEFFGKFVSTGEHVELNTRAKDFCDGEGITINIYDADPIDENEDANLLGSQGASIACPGPWTIGNTIAPGLELAYYVSTADNGLTFTYNFVEAEVQINYVAFNSGRTPLTVTGGSYNGDSPFTSGDFGAAGNIVARDQQVLKSDTQVIQLEGKAGTSFNFFAAVDGTSANEFAIPCTTTASYAIEL